MISKVLIIVIIGLIIYFIRNLVVEAETTQKVQNKDDKDIIDAEFKVVDKDND